MGDWFHDPNADPNYKQIVEKSLALFGVFTGVTLSFYIKDFLIEGKPDYSLGLPFGTRALVACAVIALLLRYIVGSAAHLNATYVGDTQPTTGDKVARKSTSLGWLFFDIAMLVVFGVLAASIAYPGDFDQLLIRSGMFVLAGLLWAGVAFCFRQQDRPIAIPWLIIDVFQLVATGFLWWVAWSVTVKAALLAIMYVGCLYLDFLAVSKPKTLQPKGKDKADFARPLRPAE
jgi:hypothetical protein